MDAKAELRRYLEQRRELGESEFVLDNMSVDEALRALGAIRGGALRRRASQEVAPAISVSVASAVPEDTPPVAPPESVQIDPDPSPVVLPTAPVVRSQPAEEESDDMAKTAETKEGLVVGSRNENLFSNNPFSDCKSLSALEKVIAECTRCPLYKTATNPVPGEGNPKADMICVGEAPGANEDATGRPFVGAAGQLLTKILAAVDVKREDVFICNVLKHRPPGNRNPQPNEVTACSPYLIRQIELIRPKVIVAFGTFAAQTLLDTKTPIGKLRGMVHRYYGVPLVVTYHPAALLRNPAWKRPTWEDVKLARRVLDHPTG